MSKPVVIIQARTGSTRLPNKMILPFYADKPVLKILLERLKDKLSSTGIDIIVATSMKPQDGPIVELCTEMDVKTFRGSEDDVLKRFIGASEAYGANKLIRICADNVFLDLDSLIVLAEYLENSQNDYVSFKKEDGTPSILTHYGFFCEGVTLDALKKVNKRTKEKLFHEHVTNGVYLSPDIFDIKLLPIESVIPGLESHPNLRLTLDTHDDFEVQQTIYSYLIATNIPVTPANIINYLDNENPALYERMAKTIKENSKK